VNDNVEKRPAEAVDKHEKQEEEEEKSLSL